MTEDEIYQIFLDMMEERKVAKLLPWEPSRMDFAMKVAKIAYEKGFDDGMVKGKNEGIVFCMEQPQKCKISYDYLKLQENQK